MKSLILKFINKYQDRKYEKVKAKCQNVSDEELIRRLVAFMKKYSGKHNHIFEFMKYKQLPSSEDNIRYLESTLKLLMTTNLNSKDAILTRWHIYNSKAKKYWTQKNSVEMIEYDAKLLNLLCEVAKNTGLHVTIVDERTESVSGSYRFWLNRIGYEGTVRITA